MNKIILMKSLLVVTVSFGLCVVYFQTHTHPLLNLKDKGIIMVVIKSHNINVISIIQAIIWNICTRY
jgi:hypothetical protein